MKKIEFETYRDLTNAYSISGMKSDKPTAINFLSYKKFKVTIEEVEEPKAVLINRLKTLLKETTGFSQQNRIKNEIKRLELLP